MPLVDVKCMATSGGAAMTSSERVYFYGVDLIRFAAALMVAFFHISFSAWAFPDSGGQRYRQGVYSFPDMARVTWIGWIGVEIFFVISGLVIANSAARASPSSFVRSRALRLYPAAWICASLTILTQLAIGQFPRVSRVLASYTLMPGVSYVDGQYWTLGVEIVFYGCVWALLWLSSYNRINMLAIALTLGGLASLVIVVLNPRAAQFLAEGHGRILPLYYAPLFALGIVIRQLFAGDRSVLMIAAGVTAFATSVAEVIRRAPQYANAPGFSFSVAVPALVFVAVVGFLILSLRYASTIHRLPPSVLAVVKALGLATYPLYLLHFAIGVTGLRLLVQARLEPHTALMLVIGLLIAAALLIASWIEPALRRFIIKGVGQLVRPGRRLQGLVPAARPAVDIVASVEQPAAGRSCM